MTAAAQPSDPRYLRRNLPHLASARAAVRTAWSAGLRPDPDLSPADWAQQHRIVAEGTSARPGRWRNDRARYLEHVMNWASPTHPCERGVLMKGVQIGASAAAENILGWIIDVMPCPAMVVHPTREAALDWNAEKFDPMIEATPRLRKKVSEVVSRGNAGSTMRRKRFPGGSIVLTGANSAAGLRQKSIRILIRDDFDEWPFDVGGQGDPARMAEARLTSFRRAGLAKIIDISTPTNEATSRIWKGWKSGTQGEIEVPCPHCGAYQTLDWGSEDEPTKPLHWRFDPEPPHRARYVCRHCGGEIFQHHLTAMMRDHRLVERQPDPGRHPSLRVNSFYSEFDSWDAIVRRYLEVKDDLEELKTFVNLSLGLPYRAASDVPRVLTLMQRREDWPLSLVPEAVLILVLGADVQLDGIFYEVTGWARDRQSWSIEYGFIDGDTSIEGAGAWPKLDALLRRRWRDVLGNDRPLDAAAIDARYNTEAVIAFTKRRPGVYPVRGEYGPKVPAWSGRLVAREFTVRGRRRRSGSKSYPVGTWALKERHFGALRLQRDDGASGWPAGYCHFGAHHDEDFFEQITAELFVRTKDRKTGRIRVDWHQSGPNHFLDCRIYAMAMAEKCGLTRNNEADWERISRRWARAASPPQPDLFETAPQPAAVTTTAVPEKGEKSPEAAVNRPVAALHTPPLAAESLPEAPPPASPHRDDWLDRVGDGWLR
jgi:phage terminase large subunit GpA-like protein